MSAWNPDLLTQLKNLPEGITQLLRNWGDGDKEALDALIVHLYDHLHKEAGRHLGKFLARGGTLQATALVNEAYLKLSKKQNVSFVNRQQFFWFSSQMIRHIIVDHIRANCRVKRQGAKVLFDENIHEEALRKITPGALEPGILLSIDKALSELETVNPRRCQIVTLRFILGTSIQETAEIMELSVTTIKDEWTVAKQWLFKKLNPAFR